MHEEILIVITTVFCEHSDAWDPFQKQNKKQNENVGSIAFVFTLLIPYTRMYRYIRIYQSLLVNGNGKINK